MRFNSVGFALSVGMALIVVLIGFTLLSAAGLAGFAEQDEIAAAVDRDSVGMVNYQGGCIASPPTLLSDLPPAEAKIAAVGDALYKNNCAQCHAVNEVVVGPALAGITKRRPISWLIPWVKNSSKVVASGDEYAVNLFAKYNKQQMPSFDLSDKEIHAIMMYITWQQGDRVVATIQ